ncbi:hypothetical protein HMPREF0476_1498 [Kingella kingae ATCC 23330]|uniref:Uncharacterized protein n=1 Tax=Kingella kingae ATCC 23330 TaxID=887327 RepID=F5S8G5_KINKI|nr:hypothetical protein HMPREF0476_1498 [Kingella kingae ATCC 23330]
MICAKFHKKVAFLMIKLDFLQHFRQNRFFFFFQITDSWSKHSHII